MPLTEDNILLNLLVEAVATFSLDTIKFGQLSIAGLEYHLYCTHEKEKSFATPECVAEKKVSNDVCKGLMRQLPTLEPLKQIKNQMQVEN
ncbi:BTB/POZ protein [Rhizophagus clarus]|uniref:BTB/POZ protein n=1 Tax=Rhizophagus clarus TaxID=94130 RepID=A0A8H3M2L4_9GLOM|nr:BTB/POZ protein [Rhizophagus clarus]